MSTVRTVIALPDYLSALICALLACALHLSGLAVCTHAETPTVRVYTVRGIVRQLPQNASDRTIIIKHEAIPDYVSEDGNQAGMRAMTMPFRLDPQLDYSSLKVGDEIEFQWRVSWSPPTEDRIVTLKKLAVGSVKLEG